MVDAALFSSDKTIWETPRDLFEELDEEFQFDLDAAASDNNKLCMMYYDEEGDGLVYPWYVPGKIETVWVNPPYGRGITGKWVKKAYEEWQKGTTVVMLLPARTDTKWFHSYIYNKPGVEIRFIKGRLKFTLNGEPIRDKNGRPTGAPFPSMIVIFRDSKRYVNCHNCQKTYPAQALEGALCKDCREEEPKEEKKCTVCFGSGFVSYKIPCDRPNTDYDVIYPPCPKCDGKGTIPADQSPGLDRHDNGEAWKKKHDLPPELP